MQRYAQQFMHKDINILFFDDKKFLLKGLQRHFSGEFTCHIATTLEEAESILSSNEIRILVADHQMPDDMGLRLLERLKDNNMRKILTTSDRHSDLVLQLIKDNIVHGIVYTPLSRDVLRDEIMAQIKVLESADN